MALSDPQLRQASPRARDWKLSDSGGLYILVRPNGSKLWRMFPGSANGVINQIENTAGRAP